MSRERQNAEIYRPMCEELFNNLDKQYQELAKVKAESDQIEEMAEVMRHTCEGECFVNKDGFTDCEVCHSCQLYEAGYRKQSEPISCDHENGGEWIDKPTGAYGRMQSWCSACGKHSGIGGIESNRHKPYCPNCGAKMKGGTE